GPSVGAHGAAAHRLEEGTQRWLGQLVPEEEVLAVAAHTEEARTEPLARQELEAFDEAEPAVVRRAARDQRRDREEELVDEASLEQGAERPRSRLGDDQLVPARAESGDRPRQAGGR